MGSPGSSCSEGPTPSQMQAQMTPASPFTPEEAEIYRRLQEKQLRFSADQRQEQTKVPTPSFSKSLSDTYWQNMVLIRNSDGTYGNPRF